MKLYIYINKNILFDFLSRNIIAPDCVVKDLKGYRTISTASDYFLFATHKKLDRKSREKGIGEPDFVCPITLELSDLGEADGQAVLVSEKNGELEYSLSKLSEYDENKHIGAYLIGEIPISRVQKIYFDTKEDQDAFYRPSPDYWYPTDKYDLLPEDFNEEFSVELEGGKVLASSALSKDEIISYISAREKHRAGLLNFLDGTKKWQYGKYIFNIDSSMQQLIGLADSDVGAILPHYIEEKGRDNLESICLIGDNKGEQSNVNQIIYNTISDILISQPYNTQKQPDYIANILENISTKIAADIESQDEASCACKCVDEIREMVLDTSKKLPDEILSSVPESMDVLKALLFVVKNPNRYDIFINSLDAYHADVLTKRRAMILWGMLNGLCGMPGENFNKDNQELWQFIEAFVLKNNSDDKVSLTAEEPDIKLKSSKVLGIQLKEERIVTAAEVRELILANRETEFSSEFYSKLHEAAVMELGSKKKAENKGYTHIIASVGLAEIKPGMEINSSMKKDLEQLLKDCKSPVPNKEKLFTDYVVDEKKFEQVFRIDQAYWKKVYTVLSEKKPKEKTEGKDA